MKLELSNKESMIKGINKSLKTVEGFLQNHDRRAKTAEEKLKEVEKKLKKKVMSSGRQMSRLSF